MYGEIVTKWNSDQNKSPSQLEWATCQGLSKQDKVRQIKAFDIWGKNVSAHHHTIRETIGLKKTSSLV